MRKFKENSKRKKNQEKNSKFDEKFRKISNSKKSGSTKNSKFDRNIFREKSGKIMQIRRKYSGKNLKF